MSNEKYSYSHNEEFYQESHPTPEDAAMSGFANDPSAESVWVGRNIEVTPVDFVNILSFIEELQEAAGDECGEVSEDWLEDLAKDTVKKDELKALIGGWLNENYPIKFWTVDDVEQFHRDDVLSGGSDD